MQQLLQVEHRVVQQQVKVEMAVLVQQDSQVVRLDSPVSRVQNLRQLPKAAHADVAATEMAVVQIEDNT